MISKYLYGYKIIFGSLDCTIITAAHTYLQLSCSMGRAGMEVQWGWGGFQTFRGKHLNSRKTLKLVYISGKNNAKRKTPWCARRHSTAIASSHERVCSCLGRGCRCGRGARAGRAAGSVATAPRTGPAVSSDARAGRLVWFWG